MSAPSGVSVTVAIAHGGLPAGSRVQLALVTDTADLARRAPPPSGTEIVFGVYARNAVGGELTGDVIRQISANVSVPRALFPAGTVSRDLTLAV